MHNEIELDMLIHYIGEKKARELAELAREPSATGSVPQRALDELAKAVKGYSGMYGVPSEFWKALEDLKERY